MKIDADMADFSDQLFQFKTRIQNNYSRSISDGHIEFETFHHYRKVSLNSSQYLDSCWTKINFSQGVTKMMLEKGILADPDFEYGNGEATTAGVFNLLQSIGGILLNGLIILVIMRNSKIRKEYLTPSILSIAITDFIFSIYILPIMTTIFLTHDVPFPDGCRSYGYIGYSLWLNAALSLLGIGILRSYVMFFPKNIIYKRFQYTCKLTPIVGLVFALLVSFPTYLGKLGQFGVECKSFRCKQIDINWNEEPTNINPKDFYFTFIIIAGVLMISLNVASFHLVKKHSKSLLQKLKDINPDAANKMVEKEKKMGKMVVIIVTSYAIVYMPITILTAVVPNATITQHQLIVAAHILLCSLVIIDPLIYIFCHDKYLKEIKILITLVFPKMSMKNNSKNLAKRESDGSSNNESTLATET